MSQPKATHMCGNASKANCMCVHVSIYICMWIHIYLYVSVHYYIVLQKYLDVEEGLCFKNIVISGIFSSKGWIRNKVHHHVRIACIYFAEQATCFILLEEERWTTIFAIILFFAAMIYIILMCNYLTQEQIFIFSHFIQYFILV